MSLLESQGSTTSGIQDNDDDDFKPKNSKKPSSKTEKTKIEKTKTVTETVNNNHKKNEIVCTVDVIEEKKSDTEICDNVLKNRGNENTEKLDRNDGKSPTDIKKENPKVLSEIQNNKTGTCSNKYVKKSFFFKYVKYKCSHHLKMKCLLFIYL